VYRQQGADLAFVTGMMFWPMTDDRFFQARELARQQGIQNDFDIRTLPRAPHPNTVLVELVDREGKKIVAEASSIGGGAIQISRLNGWNICLEGKNFDYLIQTERAAQDIFNKHILSMGLESLLKSVQEQDENALFHLRNVEAISEKVWNELTALPGVQESWSCEPVFFVQKGPILFASSRDMIALSQSQTCSLGEIVLEYESSLLGLSRNEALAEMGRRYDVMQASVVQGFSHTEINMQLLQPTAGDILQAEKQGRLALGGLHTRAAAAAMAAMHVSNSMGVVCAAPTGGAAGTLPGVIKTLAEEKDMSRDQICLSLFAAAGVGLILAHRATFAAETAGCQVEIGAAGAMASAAVVEFAGGDAQQAVDAAAISFQNTMGSVCDLVQGMCEIPCHTRNAVAASSAFVCADLILGGYHNPVPLDETIDAVFSSGKMLPSELRCTALGGLAQAPSALTLPRLR
jgi:L-serine dehydratase